MVLENSTLVIGFNWSAEVIAITLLTVILVLGIIISYYSRWPVNLSLLKYILTIVILLIIIIPAVYSPIRLSINDEKIVLKRIVGNIEIDLKDVYSVKIISDREISNSIRTFGSGGLFGYLGQFRNNLIGSYTMYATEKRNLIYINTSKGKYVFSCSKPHEFIELANQEKKKVLYYNTVSTRVYRSGAPSGDEFQPYADKQFTRNKMIHIDFEVKEPTTENGFVLDSSEAIEEGDNVSIGGDGNNVGVEPN